MKKKFVKMISMMLIAVSLLAIALPAMAGELTVSSGQTQKYLYDISGRSTAPTFSVRTFNTPTGTTATVKLNYNDLTVGSTYFKFSNSIGVSGGMTEKTLRENTSNFKFVPGRSDRAQIVLTGSNGTISIRFNMN